MADAQDSDTTGATSAKDSDSSTQESKLVSMDEEINDGDNDETDGQAGQDQACSRSISDTSADNPLENNDSDDSGMMLEKSLPVLSPEPQLTTNDSAIALASSSTEGDSDMQKDENPKPGSPAEWADKDSTHEPASVEVTEDSDDLDDLAAVTVRNIRRRNHDQLDSSSDTDSPLYEPRSDPEDESDDDDEEEETVSVEDLPKDTWNPFKEITGRELGASSRRYNSFSLRESTGSSITLVRRLELHSKLNHHEGCVNSLHFNSTGSLLASGSDDLNIVVWDWARKQPYFVFDSGHRSNVFQSKFVPHCGDSLMVSCARDGCVRLAEFSSAGSCRGTKKLAQHRGAAHKIALLDDSPHVCYSCGEDAIVFQIDLRTSKPERVCVTKENDQKIALYSIHTNPSRTHEFCVGGRDSFIRIYDTRMLGEGEDNMACVKKFCPHHLMAEGNDIKANVTCAVYNWNGTEVIGTYNDEDIYMFDTSHSDGANYIHRYKGHRNNATVKGVNYYGPKSEFIVSGSDCGNVFLWEKESEKIVNYFKGDDGGVVNVLEPHPHNPYLAISGLDHDVKIFLPTAEHPSTLEGLKEVKRKNRRQRERERSMEPDIDSRVMWMLLQQFRRSARAQRREAAEYTPSGSDDDMDDSDPDEPPQCATA